MLTGIRQTTNMSPRLNTHDSIIRNFIAIPGATQTTNMSQLFNTLKRS